MNIAGTEFSLSGGYQGNNNAKDADGGNPANTLLPAASGSVLVLDVPTSVAEGVVYVIGKFSQNKQYVVTEDNQFIGYTIICDGTAAGQAKALVAEVKAPCTRYIYYCDILVATNRGYEELIKKILSNKIEFMSMGCESSVTTCSKCGKEYYTDDDVLCDCLVNSKGKYYIDADGCKRRIAEIIGTSQPGSCEFIEASWLTEIPAFEGACKRNILQIPHNTSIEVEIPEEFLSKDALTKYIS